jgi:hypothetical protein
MRHCRAFVTAFSLGAFLASGVADAHCDTLAGPVVSAARQALDSGNVKLVLVWVQQTDEPEIRRLFDKVRAARAAGGDASELADRLFFETLVRLHRAREGAEYKGLKPIATLEPSVVAVDRSIANGRLVSVSKLISVHTDQVLREQFEALMAKKPHDPDDIVAGRAYAKAYVEFVHYVDRLYEAAEALAPGNPALRAAAALAD